MFGTSSKSFSNGLVVSDEHVALGGTSWSVAHIKNVTVTRASDGSGIIGWLMLTLVGLLFLIPGLGSGHIGIVLFGAVPLGISILGMLGSNEKRKSLMVAIQVNTLPTVIFQSTDHDEAHKVAETIRAAMSRMNR